MYARAVLLIKHQPDNLRHDITLRGRYGQVEAAQQLTLRGASTGARDIQGNTPLHLACCSGGNDIVRLLVNNGSPLKVETLHLPEHMVFLLAHTFERFVCNKGFLEG